MKSFTSTVTGLRLVPLILTVRPERTQLEHPVPRHRMLGGDLDGFVEVGALQDIEASDQILGLGVGAVGQQHFAVADADSGGIISRPDTVAHQSNLLAVHFPDPIFYVRRAIVWAGREVGVDTYEHQVLHRALLVRST